LVCADLNARARRDTVDELHRPSRSVVGKDPLAAAEQDRLDHQVELVDQPFGEQGPDEEAATPYRVPVFANRNGQLSCRYQRSGLAGGQRELGVPLDDRDIEALNLFDEVAASPENRLAFFLERGDMIVVNNYTVMHARTRFSNFPEPERKRRLLRLWLDAEGFRDVPGEFRLFARSNGVPRQDGRRASFDFRKLYQDDPVATGGVPDLKVSDGDAAQRR